MDIEYTKDRPLRCFFAFEGYNSQGMALERLKDIEPSFEWECVGRSEIDRYAIKACEAVFPKEIGMNYGDISRIDWERVPDFDLFTMTSPCTDFSIIGKQLGGEEGSGTRSSLLWECRKAIVIKRPKYILFENVRNLVSPKFLHLFNIWREELESLGYSNHYALLNSKDYGVPQNRERVFMVSCFGGSEFSFPKPIPLNKSIRDILDKNPARSLYLDKKLKSEDMGGYKFVSYTRDGEGRIVNRNLRDISNTVHTSTGGGGNTDMYIAVPKHISEHSDEYEIRKVSVSEMLRLMGVSDTHIDILLGCGISNTQLRKLAGNSIVVDVLFHIFRNMFIDKEQTGLQLTLF